MKNILIKIRINKDIIINNKVKILTINKLEGIEEQKNI